MSYWNLRYNNRNFPIWKTEPLEAVEQSKRSSVLFIWEYEEGKKNTGIEKNWRNKGQKLKLVRV